MTKLNLTVIILLIQLLSVLQSSCDQILSRRSRVVNGKIVNGGLYIIQNEENKKAILTVGGDEFGKSFIVGEPLSKAITAKWTNGEDQKWDVKEWGKIYHFISPVEKKENDLTFKIISGDFRLKNIWEIIDPTGKKEVWQIRLYRKKGCLTYLGLNKEVEIAKCDPRAENQQWHFHLLNE